MVIRYLRWCVMVAAVLLLESLAVQAQPSTQLQQTTGTEVLWLESDAPVCRDVQPGARCEAEGAADGIFAQVGPGDDCCVRHAEFCSITCICGISSFSCWDNGRGGCSSSCRCVFCPV